MELTKQATSNSNELYFSCEAAEREQLAPLTEKLRKAGYEPRFEASSDPLSRRAYVLVIGAQGISPTQQADLKEAQKWASRDQQYRLFAGGRAFKLVVIRLPGAPDQLQLNFPRLSYSLLDFRAGLDDTAAEKLIATLNAPPPTEQQLAIEPARPDDLVLESEPGALEVSPEEASPPPPVAPPKQKPLTAYRKLLIYGGIGLAALLLILALAEVRNQKQQNQLTNYQKLVAEEKQQIALSREIAANSNLYTKTDPQLSLLLAVEAAKTFPTSEAEQALRQAVTRPVPRKLPFGSPNEANNFTTVMSVFSQDGRFVALSLSPRDTTQPWLVQVWDLLNEQKVAELPATTTDIYDMTFSPNNALLYTGGSSSTAQVWEIASQKVLHEMKGSNLGVVFSPNSGLIAIGGAYTGLNVKVLDSTTGAVVAEIPNSLLSDRIYRATQSLAFSPDSKLLAYGYGPSIQVFEIATGKVLPGFSNDTASRGNLTFSPDGKLLAEIDKDNNIRLWEVETGKLKNTLYVGASNGELWRLVFSPDGSTIAASGYNDFTNILSANNGRYNAYIQGDFIQWSPDGRNILARSYRTKTLMLVEAGDGQTLVEMPQSSEILDARFVAGGKAVVAINSQFNYKRESLSIWRWEVAPKTARATIKASNRPITRLVFSPDGRLLAHSSFDNTAQVLDVSSGQVLATLRGHTEDVLKILFSPDGKLLVTSSRDGTARLWEAATGRSKGVLLGHTKAINDAAFSPDSKYVVTVSDDFTARIWEVESGRTVTILTSQAALSNVLFSPDGKRLLTFGSNLPQLWEGDTGKLVRDLDLGRHLVLSAVFSPDSKYLFLGGYTESAQVVDAITGLKLVDLDGKFGELRGAIFSPDSKRLTTTEGGEGSGWLVRSWDSRSGQEIGRYPPNFNGTYGASVFSPDGKFGAVLTNKSVFIWEVGTGVTISQIPLEDTFFVQSNMAFSPDSRVLAMGSSGGDIRLFAMPECGGVADLLGLASYKSYRELTPAERETYLHQ